MVVVIGHSLYNFLHDCIQPLSYFKMIYFLAFGQSIKGRFRVCLSPWDLSIHCALGIAESTQWLPCLVVCLCGFIMSWHLDLRCKNYWILNNYFSIENSIKYIKMSFFKGKIGTSFWYSWKVPDEYNFMEVQFHYYFLDLT
jgi:hypothetical protein